jgi:hypothetical protein
MRNHHLERRSTMKARLLIVFVLTLGLALPLAQSAAAQGPLPDKPKPVNPSPTGTPLERRAAHDSQPLPRAASSSGGSAGHSLGRRAARKDQSLVHTASSSGAAGTQGVSAAITPGLPGTAYRYVQTFGETEVAYFEDDAYLAYPFGVGVDDLDNLWVGEILGARAMEYDTSDGSFLMSFGTAGLIGLVDDTHFYGVADVATDGDGDVWVVDRDPARVAEYDGVSGDYLGQLGVTWETGTDEDHFNNPQSVAFDGWGWIHVSDADNQRIQVFNSSGAYYGTLGTTGIAGTGNDQFDSPRHITVDDYNYMYVADAGNHRVQIYYTGNYSYVGTLGVTGVAGSDDEHFNWPIGVAADANYIYVADQNNHRVQIFDTYLDYVGTIGTGTAGSGNDQFNYPSDVAVDSAGNIYVADQGNMRVQEFDSGWNYVRTFGTTGVPYQTDADHYNEPYGVAVDATGNIAVVEDEQRGHRLIKLDSSGTALFTVGEPGIGGDDTAHLEDPNAVAFDSSGAVYVADSGNNRVQIFSSGGAYQATLGTGWGTGNTQFKYPDGIAVGSNGYIYVSDRDNHRVQIYNSSRTYVATIGQTGVSGADNARFNRPRGVYVDGSGAIYVADTGNQRVQKFNSSRAWVMTLGTTGQAGSDFDHFSDPSDVAVDTAGRIFVADRFNQRVQVFSAAGAYLTTVGNAWGGTTGRLREPTGVDVDGAGNVYVADHHNQRIQKFAFGVPDWLQSNLNGFGNPHNANALSLESFGGFLYAGTYTPGGGNGAQLWRFSSSWAPVMTNGFGAAANVGIDDLIEFKNNLYAGTWNEASGGQVQRSSNGTTWAPVTSPGFGDPTNGEIFGFAVFSDTLYASTWSYTSTHGAEIWRSSTGNTGSWARVVSNGFDGDANNGAVTAMGVFNGRLYAGTDNRNFTTGSSTGAEVWRTGNGSAWQQVNTDGFGTANNVAVSALAEFDGRLYASTATESGVGAQVWRCQVCANSDWQRVVDNGFGNSATGDLSALEVFEGQLYFIVGNSTAGLEIWRSDTGDSGDWEQVGFAGLGDSNNRAPYWDNSVAVFNNVLFLGTVNGANGGEVWQSLSLLDQSVYLPALLKNR